MSTRTPRLRIDAPVGFLLGISLLLAVAVAALAASPADFALSARPHPAAARSFPLFGSLAGWGTTSGSISSPGPTLAVVLGDEVTITLNSADGRPHNWLLDYDGDTNEDAGEPLSNVFSGSPEVLTFTATTAGTFTYWCTVHFGSMFGAFVVLAPEDPPFASLSMPDGVQRWTGGSTHRIWWNLSDAQDPNSALVVYVNYSSSAGSGPIAGPLAGTSNPNHLDWSLPAIDATDVVVNLTVIDTGGRKAFEEALVPVIDSTAPQLSGRFPGSGATDVPRSAIVMITFSEGMNPSATGSPSTVALREDPAGPWIPGTVSWDGPANTVLTFDPLPTLAASASYRVFVNASARDESDPGNPLASADSWTFTAGATVDTTAPVIAHVPPGSIPLGEGLEIAATVTDDGAVASVRLNWTDPTGANLNLSMSASGDRYSTLIPQQLYAGTVSYFLVAVDAGGNAVRNPTATVPVAAPPGVVVLFGNLRGWGFSPDSLSTPGPTLTLSEGESIELLIIGYGGAFPVRHDFYVDWDRNGAPGPGDTVSADVRGNSTRLTLRGEHVGTFTYFCAYHPSTMFGAVVVTGASPAGGLDPLLLGGIGVAAVAVVAGVVLLRRRGKSP
ncbi:MAG: hypothetical protein A3K66_02245 [Euryarchaeota archaeon RBG_16_67_27]|nr:MAG: hypothetical protein A3K66_02245 [Euryarchaeota archaeon RBG_16_67_27]